MTFGASDFRNFFRELGLPPRNIAEADMSVVKKHYRQTMRACHPDKVATADPGLEEKAKYLTMEMRQ